MSHILLLFLFGLQMTRNPMQSKGCCGVVKALQANSGTGLEILDLPVSVTPERRGKGGKRLNAWCMNNKVLPEGFWLWWCCCPVRAGYGGNGPHLKWACLYVPRPHFVCLQQHQNAWMHQTGLCSGLGQQQGVEEAGLGSRC